MDDEQEVQTEVTDEASEAVDAALDQIMADEPQVEEAPAEEEEVAEVEEDAPEEVQASDDDEGSSEEEVEEPRVDDVQLGQAYQALLRDGFGKDQVDQMLETFGPEKFLAHGLRRAKVQEDVDRAYGKLQNRSKEGDSSADEEGTDGDTLHADAQPSTLNLKESAQPLAEALGLDDPDALVGFGNQLVQHYEAQNKELRQGLQVLGGVLTDLALNGAKSELEIDQLQDNETWSKVKERYSELSVTTLHSDLPPVERMRELLKSAARLELPDLPSEQEIQRKVNVRKAKRKGVATVSKRKAPARTLSPKEKTDAILEKIMNEEVGSVEEAIVAARNL